MNRIVVKTVTPQTNDQRRSEWAERFYREGHHHDLNRRTISNQYHAGTVRHGDK